MSTNNFLENPVSEKRLVRYDALYSYCKRLEAFPILSREEEHDLATKYCKTKDPEIAKKLICSNLRLVVSAANSYAMMHRNLLDLIQEGNLGLIVAIQKYDPYRGTRFSSYATFWIRAHMLRFLLDNSHLVRMGRSRSERKLFFNLNKVRNALEKGSEIKATAAHIAKVMDLDESEVNGMMVRMGSAEVSLDSTTNYFDDGSVSLLDSIPAEAETRPDRLLEASEEESQYKSIIQIFGERLEGRDKFIFENRFIAEKPLALEKIGRVYGISKERARQVEEKLKERLRAFVVRQVN